MTTGVECQHCKSLKELSAREVQPGGTVAICPQCAGETAASQRTLLTKDGPLQEVDGSVQSVAQAMEFRTPVKFNTLTKRDNRFKGKGVLEIKGDQLLITGVRNKLFSRARVTETYPLSSIYNLSQAGDAICFNVPLDKGQWAAVLNCPDEAAAGELAALLPTLTDSKYFNAEQANLELEKRVAELPGTAAAVWTLLVLNCLIYLIVAYTGKKWFSFNADYLATVGGNLSPLTTEGEWWRMLSATFLHGGFIHLGFNMYALYSFGILTEKIYGTRDFLLIYLLAGLAGSAGTLMFSPTAVGVGASGAIFGVIGAMMAFLTTDRSFLTEGSRKQLMYSFAIFGSYSLMQGFSHSGIDNAAHIGGGLAGFVIGWSIGTPFQLREQRRGRLTARLAFGVCAVLLATGSIMTFSPRLSQQYKTHIAMIEILRELSTREKALSEYINTNLPKDNNGTIEDARRFAAKTRETYSGISEKLAAIQVGTPVLEDRKSLLADYVNAKKTSMEMFAVSMERNDNNILEEAKKKAASAKKIGTELAKPVRWNE